MATTTPNVMAPTRVDSPHETVTLKPRTPVRILSEGLHLDVNYSSGDDDILLRFQRLGLKVDFPLGALFWRTPLEGHLAFGIERASLAFQNEDKREHQTIDVDADSEPTFYLGGGATFFMLGEQNMPQLVSHSFMDVFAFADASTSIFPKEFDNYRVDVDGDNAILKWVDVNALAQKNIRDIRYSLVDIDLGFGFRLRISPHFQPFVRVGYTQFDAAVHLAYEANGRQLMKASRINHRQLLKGEFDFSKRFFNVAAGANIAAGSWFRFDIDGMWRPNNDGFLGEWIGMDETGIGVINAALTLFLEEMD